MAITLGVLDQSPIREGGTAAEAIEETLRLAQATERLGYTRYWLAEHHNSTGLACAAPEVLIPRVASVTSRIRVGSGGVMLPHYSPLKVAEQFRMLETMFPGRIDLGLGRAPGTDGRTSAALAPGPGMRTVEHYPHQVADLMRLLRDDLPEGHPLTGIHAQPLGPTVPMPWLLGSSLDSANTAAEQGLPFSFAHFIQDQWAGEAITLYRRLFRPSQWLDEPTVNVGVSAICADTDEEAERLAMSAGCGACATARACAAACPRPTTPRPSASRRRSATTSSTRSRAASSADPSACASASRRSPWSSRSASSWSSQSLTTSRTGCAPTSCWPRPSD